MWTKWLALGGLLALTPASALAQTAWDLTGLAGFFAGHATTPASDGEDWFQSAQGGVVLGRYFTPRIKVAIEAAGTTAGTRYIARRVALPGLPTPYWISSEETTSIRSIGAVFGWQFRENEWVHPFIEAGLSADRERRTIFTPQQFYFPSDPRSGTLPQPIADGGTETTASWHLRALMGGGAKLYFRERAFVRTDGRVTFDRHRRHVMFRVGLGVDF